MVKYIYKYLTHDLMNTFDLCSKWLSTLYKYLTHDLMNTYDLCSKWLSTYTST